MSNPQIAIRCPEHVVAKHRQLDREYKKRGMRLWTLLDRVYTRELARFARQETAHE